MELDEIGRLLLSRQGLRAVRRIGRHYHVAERVKDELVRRARGVVDRVVGELPKDPIRDGELRGRPFPRPQVARSPDSPYEPHTSWDLGLLRLALNRVGIVAPWSQAALLGAEEEIRETARRSFRGRGLVLGGEPGIVAVGSTVERAVDAFCSSRSGHGYDTMGSPIDGFDGRARIWNATFTCDGALYEASGVYVFGGAAMTRWASDGLDAQEQQEDGACGPPEHGGHEPIVFTMSEGQAGKVDAWRASHEAEKHGGRKSMAAIGGRYTAMFTPTSLGTVCVVRCSCGGEIDVTDDDW